MDNSRFDEWFEEERGSSPKVTESFKEPKKEEEEEEEIDLDTIYQENRHTWRPLD